MWRLLSAVMNSSKLWHTSVQSAVRALAAANMSAWMVSSSAGTRVATSAHATVSLAPAAHE